VKEIYLAQDRQKTREKHHAPVQQAAEAKDVTNNDVLIQKASIHLENLSILVLFL